MLSDRESTGAQEKAQSKPADLQQIARPCAKEALEPRRFWCGHKAQHASHGLPYSGRVGWPVS